jgi:hypothetical protein
MPLKGKAVSRFPAVFDDINVVDLRRLNFFPHGKVVGGQHIDLNPIAPLVVLRLVGHQEKFMAPQGSRNGEWQQS